MCISSVATLFVKVSLLVLYLRIFLPELRARVMVWIGIILMNLFYMAMTAFQIKFYVPAPGESYLLQKESIFLDIFDVAATQGIFHVLSDFYILFIPMHIVVGLRLSPQRKIGVCAIFLTGLAYVVISLGSHDHTNCH